jgi:predicted RNase H-like HicB family nuclease
VDRWFGIETWVEGVYVFCGSDNAMSERTFSAVVHKEEDLFVAECPEVGTVSQGYTLEEAVANLKEATELYLEEFPHLITSRVIITTFEATYG